MIRAESLSKYQGALMSADDMISRFIFFKTYSVVISQKESSTNDQSFFWNHGQNNLHRRDSHRKGIRAGGVREKSEIVLEGGGR